MTDISHDRNAAVIGDGAAGLDRGRGLAEGAAAPAPSARMLALSGGFFFVVLLLGQWAFFYYIAAFYGASTLSGDFEVWNRLAAIGRAPYVEGDRLGNLAYAGHALAAGVIAFGGALQLVPQIRQHAPVFHRWNGRLFLATVIGLSLSGFYLVWVRNTSPSFVDGLSTSFNGVLILTFVLLAGRAAMARNIAVHRRWAMRLYLVSNAQWFLRVGLFGYFAIGSLLGFQVSPGDPVLKFWTFGCYLVPLAVLELYMRAKDSAHSFAQVSVAVMLLALTLMMAVGILVFAQFCQALITGAPLSF